MISISNLTAHLLHQHTFSQSSREIAEILNQLMVASKIVSREVNKAGLVDILGKTNKVNIQGEEVQKLDEFADQVFTDLLRQSPYVKAVGSEEVDEITIFDEDYHKDSEYIVHIDPLDGSSNIDVNVSVGTNFVIFRKKSKGKELLESDYLQPGKDTICAGYVLYGSSTMLVYSSGKGVHGFTLDPSIGEFMLSHENMTYPSKGTIYSINESYEHKWSDGIRKYIQEAKSSNDVSGKAKNARYIGALVAEFHRNLLKGGIFLYPADKKNSNGKLRLLYEGIPFAYLAEQAGGYSSDGAQDVLEIVPTELHQRIPFFVGNKEDVRRLEEHLK